jgi:multidrug efflux pump subunit AcrB
MRKNLRPVIYVTADVAGAIESPVYAILEMNRGWMTSASPVRRSPLQRRAARRLDELAMKWDGEWQVTIEVFRDLGLAFAAVLLLIYVLVVGWFQSFRVPLVIMAPIPLTLIGILPGHALTGAFFTATSMIGMIALAGIIVRNSILLVDFIQLAQERGRSLRDAVHRGRRRALPAHRAHRRRRRGRRPGHGARPDLPGPGRRTHQRRRRGHAAHHGRRAAPLLGAGGATRRSGDT